ncbi:hypothetical protein Tco_1178278, partial [Tanacetum coccineum]
ASENYVLVPPKEIVKARLTALGLFDEDHPSLLSTDLDIDIAKVLFSDLIVYLHPVTGKKERKLNIYYTRFLSLIIEHLLGDSYHKVKLKIFKPHHITGNSFKTPFASEVPLTSHMLKVAKFSKEQYKSLILPPGKETSPTQQVTKSQLTEEPVATVDTTQISTIFGSFSIDQDMMGNTTYPFAISRFEAVDSHNEGTNETQTKITLTQSAEATVDNILDEMAGLKASANKPSDLLCSL